MIQRASVAVLSGVLLMLAGSAGSNAQPGAQRPPPPVAVTPAPDPSVPHLEQYRLDYSHCSYPETARRAALEGCCRMKVEVAADGAARVAGGQCTDDVFLPASRACLAPQSYAPARRNGKAVKGTGEIVVEFQLTDPEPTVWNTLMGAIFGPPPPIQKPDRSICEKRPGDMLSSLPAPHG
jgi:hypothetical protein